MSYYGLNDQIIELTFYALNWIDYNSHSSFAEGFKWLLGVYIHSWEPAAKTRMGMVPPNDHFRTTWKGNIKIRNVENKNDELEQYSKISKAGGGGSNLNLGVHIINSKIEIDIFLSFYTFHLQKNLFV